MSEKNISGITKIAVQGFKSIAEERSIDILPLTLLAGANSSGKSSIMQPLLILKQMLESGDGPGPLRKGTDRFQLRIETGNPAVSTLLKKKPGKLSVDTSDIPPSTQHYILNTIHLPASRRTPEPVYKRTSTGPGYPGTFENYTASIIHKWQEEKDERLEQVIAALRMLGLTDNVRTEKIGDSGIEIQVGRLRESRDDSKDMVSIADVGFGVSQVLPVIVAVIAAEPGQLVYLEQPELHLHPRAQLGLARVLAAAAERGIRIVAETHSSLLLLAIQTLVAEKELSPDLVALHWFSRNAAGMTEVTRGDLDAVGAYGDWPEDFDNVDLKAQGRYIKAVQARFEEGM